MAMRARAMENEEGDPRRSSVDLNEVRNLHLRYSRTKPGDPQLTVEYVGGRIKVFAVDRFFVERLLEHLEEWR